VVIDREVDMSIQEIGIEKGIDVPRARVVFAYPYEEMDVGDSFAVPVTARQKVLNANYRAFKRLGWRFIARTEGDVIRIWRTS
jgi:hypothetical protein